MSQSASPSRMAEVSAPLGPGVSPGCPVALGDGQLRYSQRAARESVVEEASPIWVPLCSDQFQLAEPGGALVSRIDTESDSAGQLPERAGSQKSDRGIYASLGRKPEALYREGHCRGHHHQDRPGAGEG